MFTGIITDVGRIEAVEQRGDLRRAFGSGSSPETADRLPDLTVRISTSYDMETVDLGASIACSGVCLTVTNKGAGFFDVDVSAETQRRTASAMWAVGSRLNLERSLKVGDELGGHIVTGHVDGVGSVAWVEPEGASIRYDIKAPARLAPYLTEKGSIAVNGVSLTVNQVEDRDDGACLSVNIIPHTIENTAVFSLGDSVNIEIDILARYLGRMMEMRR